MRLVFLCGLHVALAFLLGAPERQSAAAPVANTEPFDRGQALAFITTHCASCHSGASAKGQLVLTKLSGYAAADYSEALLWARVAERVRAGEMPPKGRPRPNNTEVASLNEWIRIELAKAEKIGPRALGVGPNFGNLVPHEALFGAPAASPTASDPRVWRNRLPVYEDYYVRMIGGKRVPSVHHYRQELTISLHEYSPPWGLGAGHGFKDYAALARVDEAELEILLANASVGVTRLLQGKPRGKPTAIGILRDSHNPGAAQIHDAISEAFQMVVQRKPTEAELRRYTAFLMKNQSLGHAKAVHTMLTAIFLHPESLYRIEIGRGAPDAHGRALLPPRELARAIAFALTDRGPDTELLRAAEAGELRTPADVRKQVERLFADEALFKSRILDFFREYFGYANAPDVFKDEKNLKEAGISGYWPESLVFDTDRLVLLVLREDKNVLAELLTTRRSFVDYLRAPDPRKAKLAAPPEPTARVSVHYNFRSEKWLPLVPVELPASERAGILTQPSWLIAHSTNFENHAIERGKWIRERLLGGALPDIPITVEAKLPEDPHRTLRQRMEVTRQTFCWQCHQKMDPLGLTFEQYDHFGRYRTTELGKPVDARGAITDSGEASLDGPVKDSLELLHRLARSERVQQVFVRHAFRFWMGRNETPADAATLQAAYRAYRDSRGSMKALITALLTSDSFLYRYATSAK